MKSITHLTTALLLTSVVTATALADMVAIKFPNIMGEKHHAFIVLERSRISVRLEASADRGTSYLRVRIRDLEPTWNFKCEKGAPNPVQAANRISTYLNKKTDIDLQEMASKAGISECKILHL